MFAGLWMWSRSPGGREGGRWRFHVCCICRRLRKESSRTLLTQEQEGNGAGGVGGAPSHPGSV